jgi:hypothetical protein
MREVETTLAKHVRRLLSASCLLLMSSCCLLALRCRLVGVNRNPVIVGMTDVTGAQAGATTAIGCAAEDPDGDTLTYHWTCTGGAISDDSLSAIAWTAPWSAEVDTISVTAFDGHGGKATKSVVVTVSMGAPGGANASSGDVPHCPCADLARSSGERASQSALNSSWNLVGRGGAEASPSLEARGGA